MTDELKHIIQLIDDMRDNRVIEVAIRAHVQAAIDAALESVKQKIYNRGEVSMKAGLPAGAGFYAAIDIIETAVGTNPLAERDAMIAELERMLESERKQNALLKFANSLFANSGDNDELAIDQLRRELAEARKDAERYRWLCDDLSGEERIKRNGILCRMPVMSYSAASADIDAATLAEREK